MDLATVVDICRCVLDGPVVGAAELDRVAELLDAAELPPLDADERDLRFLREAISDIFVALAALRRLGDPGDRATRRMSEVERRRRIATYGYVYEETLVALLEQARLYGGPAGRAWAVEACVEIFESLPRAERERILKGARDLGKHGGAK
jgi:hypothetical protein